MELNLKLRLMFQFPLLRMPQKKVTLVEGRNQIKRKVELALIH